MAQERTNSFQEITKCLNQENGLKKSPTSTKWGPLSTLEIAEKIYNLQDMISDQLYALRALKVSVAQLKDNNTRAQCEQIIQKHETELSIQEKKLAFFENQQTAMNPNETSGVQEVVLWIEKSFHQNETEFLQDIKNTFSESSSQKVKGLSESIGSIQKSANIERLTSAVQDFSNLESKTENKKSRGFFEKLLKKAHKDTETLSKDDVQKHAKETLKESGI